MIFYSSFLGGISEGIWLSQLSMLNICRDMLN